MPVIIPPNPGKARKLNCGYATSEKIMYGNRTTAISKAIQAISTSVWITRDQGGTKKIKIDLGSIFFKAIQG